MSIPSPSAAFALVKAYHSRTKHRFEAYAPGPQALDWDAQPAPFRDFEGAPQLALPRLADIAPGSTLHAALDRPLHAPTPVGECIPIDLASIGAWLQLSLGITAWKSFGPDRWAVRANPSSGNLHPVEAYLLVRDIAGLSDGIHHYRPDCHGLELRATHTAGAGNGPQLAVILTTIMWREAWKYGERAFRYCQLDVGHAVAALGHAATALGWTLDDAPMIGNATLARLCGTDRNADFPVSRYPETEREEAELMLCVQLPPAPPATIGRNAGKGIPVAEHAKTPSPLSREGGGEGATTATAATLLTAADLQARAATAQWHGIASPIDRQPIFRWPLIETIASATRQPETAVSPAPTFSATASALAQPDDCANPMSVRELLTRRRSAQRFDHRHLMSLQAFAAIVARLRPVAAPHTALVFFIHRVDGLTPGLYLLPRGEAQLTALRQQLDPRFEFAPVEGVDALLRLLPLAAPELQRLARSLHCHQDIAASSCFALGMLTAFAAALEQGPAAYRRLYRECGVMGQALYLEAEVHGLRGTGIGCFFDDPVHAVLGLKNNDWQTLYHFTVGLPVDDARIETGAAYAD
jgi:SagB-type dehydrogenase family enzyme